VQHPHPRGTLVAHKSATGAPLALSRKRAGEGHSKALVDNAQTSYRTTAITASACEVIFELWFTVTSKRSKLLRTAGACEISRDTSRTTRTITI
jgi:hypothetical protein